MIIIIIIIINVNTKTLWKTKGIQSYLRIWGTYDPIESGLSKPRKGGFCGYNVKNLIWGPILAKNVPLHPHRSLPSIMVNMKTLSFGAQS